MSTNGNATASTPESRPPCPHPDFIWRLDGCNEEGWHCMVCNAKATGEPPGYRPDLDRSHTEEKVRAVLMTMHESDLIYVSNSDQGESIVGSVVEMCRSANRHDQPSIVRFIMGGMGDGKYWADQADAILAGNDPRERCVEVGCGKLTCSHSLESGEWVGRCSDHGWALTMASLKADPRGVETADTKDPWEVFGEWLTAWRQDHPDDDRDDLALIEEYAREGNGDI